MHGRYVIYNLVGNQIEYLKQNICDVIKQNGSEVEKYDFFFSFSIRILFRL